MGNFVDIEAHMDEIKEYMPQFVFYQRGKASPAIRMLDIEFGEENRKATDCYCTCCHQRFTDYDRDPDTYQHKTKGTCHNCGAQVEYRAMFRGRKSYYYSWDFVVFEGAGDVVRLSCIVVSQQFNDGELEPEYDWYEVTRYELEPHRAVQYLKYWRYINILNIGDILREQGDLPMYGKRKRADRQTQTSIPADFTAVISDTLSLIMIR